jgi:hypothetical protein
LSAILRKSSLAIALSPPTMTPEVNISASDASAPGLTMRQCEGAYCVDPEQRRRFFMISKPRYGLPVPQ